MSDTFLDSFVHLCAVVSLSNTPLPFLKKIWPFFTGHKLVLRLLCFCLLVLIVHSSIVVAVIVHPPREIDFEQLLLIN